MDIFWGAVALVMVVGTVAVLLVRRHECPVSPWFPAGATTVPGVPELDAR
ncbi:hypothetical protein [Cellulosimicrobium marinum]|nr:hypothetical protein [Cellulosimicrobium marinum]MCB7137986.1 hypothetical protein [Cellulosimicrobium marinum]